MVCAAAALAMTAAACSRAPDNAGGSGSSSSAGSVPARDMTLNRGVVLRLRSLTALSTRTNHAGDAVKAVATQAALSEHGDTIIPADAEFTGTVTASAPGKENQPGTLQLSFAQVRWGGRSWPVGARVTSIAEEQSGRGITGGTAAKVGAGAVAGGIVGRIIGGNRTGTLVGAAAGGAAGGVYAHKTRDIDVMVPEGSTIHIMLTRPFTPEVASN
jgi:hypothetical protein